MNDTQSLSHTTYNCKYHLVFAPKYRGLVIYGKLKNDIGIILRTLCERKGIELLEAEACPDHIHMLVSIPPKYSVAQIMGYLKGKSTLMILLLMCAAWLIITRQLAMWKRYKKPSLLGMTA